MTEPAQEHLAARSNSAEADVGAPVPSALGAICLVLGFLGAIEVASGMLLGWLVGGVVGVPDASTGGSIATLPRRRAVLYILANPVTLVGAVAVAVSIGVGASLIGGGRSGTPARPRIPLFVAGLAQVALGAMVVVAAAMGGGLSFAAVVVAALGLAMATFGAGLARFAWRWRGGGTAKG